MGQLCKFNESRQEVAECTGKGSVSGEMRNQEGDKAARQIQREQARGSSVYWQRFSLWRDEKSGRQWGSCAISTRAGER